MPLENAKPVKNEAQSDDDDEKPMSLVRKKKLSTPNTTNSAASKLQSKVKKEELEQSASKPSKPTSKPTKPKEEKSGVDYDRKPFTKDDKKKVKKKKEEEKRKHEAKIRERKVYELPGQKRDPPEERDPLRIFYESLYEQKPTSELAAVWMMESGLLPMEEAKLVYEKKMSGKNRKLTSPMKPIKTVKETKSVMVKKKAEAATPTSSNKKKTTTKKRKAESSDEDSGDEFQVSTKKVVKKVKKQADE